MHTLLSRLRLDAYIVAIMATVALASVPAFTMAVSRLLKFSKEDEIAIVFCGSKKSMASGLPMANILFAKSAIGLIVLPFMLFHQMQLMVCASLTRRYSLRASEARAVLAGAPS